MIHKGYEIEQDPSLLDKDYSSEGEDFRELIACLKEIYEKDPERWTRVSKEIKGVSEETTTGVHRLYQRLEDVTLLFPATIEIIKLGFCNRVIHIKCRKQKNLSSFGNSLIAFRAELKTSSALAVRRSSAGIGTASSITGASGGKIDLDPKPFITM